MRFRPLLLILLLAMIAQPAVAAVTIRYAPDVPDAPSFVIEADDNGNVRAEDSNGQLLIIRGSEIWVAAPPASDRLMVRMEDAMAVVAERRVPGPAAPVRHRLIERGAQQVGRWQGLLYWIDPQPPAGSQRRTEIVIGTDPALAAAARAYARVDAAYVRASTALFVRPPTDFPTHSAALVARGLPLRITGLRRLESVTEGPVPLARFSPPGRVLTRDEYRAALGR